MTFSGDLILIKTRFELSKSLPSTTHPLAVHIISKILSKHGAKVIVGDQSGIRSVLHHPSRVIRGNTKTNIKVDISVR